MLPGLISGTDDTTAFLFKGTSAKLEGWYLVDLKHDKNEQSTYSNDKGGTDNKSSMRE